MKLTQKDDISSLDDIQTHYDGLYRCAVPSPGRLKRYMKVNNWILNILGVEAKKNLLDVACGNGYFLSLAESRGLKTFGIDISKVAVINAQKMAPKSNMIISAAENIPYPSNHFDYVTCLGSLEHFLSPERGCQEMARVLKKGGVSCIYVPNTFWIQNVINVWFKGKTPTQSQDIERFGTKQEWQGLFENNGLKVKRLCKYNLTPINLSYSFTFLCTKQE